jgi:hypothetical protein
MIDDFDIEPGIGEFRWTQSDFDYIGDVSIYALQKETLSLLAIVKHKIMNKSLNEFDLLAAKGYILDLADFVNDISKITLAERQTDSRVKIDFIQNKKNYLEACKILSIPLK